MKTNILFVCRYNRFRSLIAEAFFNKYNRNKNVKAKSAGVVRGNPLSENVRKLAKKYGLKIKKVPSGLSSKLLAWQNLTIIVANDVPESIFDRNKEYGKEVIIWKIPDVKTNSMKEMEVISCEIGRKIKKLIELRK